MGAWRRAEVGQRQADPLLEWRVRGRFAEPGRAAGFIGPVAELPQPRHDVPFRRRFGRGSLPPRRSCCARLQGRGTPRRRPLHAHEFAPELALRRELVVPPAAQPHVADRGLAAPRHGVDVVELLWNDLSSRHRLFLSAGLGLSLLFTEELKTTDEAGRFDDESLCYTRVAPVARHLAA